MGKYPQYLMKTQYYIKTYKQNSATNSKEKASATDN